MKRAIFGIIAVIILALTFWGNLWWLPLFLVPIWLLFFRLTSLPENIQAKVKPLFKSKITGYIITIFTAWLLVQLLRALIIEPYAVPSESMKPTILPGDKIIVNKMVYGAPFYGKPKTINAVKRLPQFSSPKRNDIIAFHLPEADSVLSGGNNYYQLCRQLGRDSVVKMHGRPKFQSIEKRPVFLKRIVGCPGDTFSIEKGLVKVNSQIENDNNDLIFMCEIKRNSVDLLNQYFIKHSISPLPDCTTEKSIAFPLLQSDYEQLINELPENVLKKQLHPINGRDPNVFPFSRRHYYNRDFAGPFLIPAKGKTVKIDYKNIDIYRHQMQHEGIDTYELDTIWGQDKSYLYFWQPKQDYYWVMGDNRHKSLDSRYWGFLPKSHIIGKAVRVWWSANPEESGFNRYRTSRFGKGLYSKAN